MRVARQGVLAVRPPAARRQRLTFPFGSHDSGLHAASAKETFDRALRTCNGRAVLQATELPHATAFVALSASVALVHTYVSASVALVHAYVLASVALVHTYVSFECMLSTACHQPMVVRIFVLFFPRKSGVCIKVLSASGFAHDFLEAASLPASRAWGSRVAAFRGTTQLACIPGRHEGPSHLSEIRRARAWKVPQSRAESKAVLLCCRRLLNISPCVVTT
eukprot:364104-Chlamydomonas_euryale.AAC.8